MYSVMLSMIHLCLWHISFSQSISINSYEIHTRIKYVDIFFTKKKPTTACNNFYDADKFSNTHILYIDMSFKWQPIKAASEWKKMSKVGIVEIKNIKKIDFSSPIFVIFEYRIYSRTFVIGFVFELEGYDSSHTVVCWFF